VYHSRYAVVRPAGQVPGHCPSLPSSSSAYEAIATGTPLAWLKVVGSTLVRGVLVGGAIHLLDPRDARWALHGLYGALGIEVFVLGYTALTAPRA
jgi:hypothetical protein